MPNDCDICSLISFNSSFAYCPDRSDQQQQYCGKRPSDAECAARCDPRMGPCTPPPPPLSPPPPQHLEAAIHRLRLALLKFRVRYVKAQHSGRSIPKEWRDAADAAVNVSEGFVASGDVNVEQLKGLLGLLEGIPGIRRNGQRVKVGRAWKRTIRSLMKVIGQVVNATM